MGFRLIAGYLAVGGWGMAGRRLKAPFCRSNVFLWLQRCVQYSCHSSIAPIQSNRFRTSKIQLSDTETLMSLRECFVHFCSMSGTHPDERFDKDLLLFHRNPVSDQNFFCLAGVVKFRQLHSHHPGE
jgi:hypothetical protein